MKTTTISDPHQLTIARTRTPSPLRHGVAIAGVQAGVLGALGTEFYGLAARAAGVTMRAGNVGGSKAEAITIGMFAMGSLVCTFWGTVLAKLCDRYAQRPAEAFRGIAVALTVVSIIAPPLAGATPTGTKVMLAGAHLVAAAVIIPILTRCLDARSTTRTATRSRS